MFRISPLIISSKEISMLFEQRLSDIANIPGLPTLFIGFSWYVKKDTTLPEIGTSTNPNTSSKCDLIAEDGSRIMKLFLPLTNNIPTSLRQRWGFQRDQSFPGDSEEEG